MKKVKKKRKKKRSKADNLGYIDKCPSCGNKKRFYEEGLAEVKTEIEEEDGGRISCIIDQEVKKFIGLIRCTCAECGAECGTWVLSPRHWL